MESHKYNLELFKEMFYYELDQKEKINSKIAIPTSILTFLIGGAFYLAKNIFKLQYNPWTPHFLASYLIFWISLFFYMIFIIKAYYKYPYKQFPSLKDIDNFTNYYISESQQKGYSRYYEKKFVADKINCLLYEIYLESADKNYELNDKKLKYLRYIMRALIVSLISGLSSYILYIITISRQ